MATQDHTSKITVFVYFVGKASDLYNPNKPLLSKFSVKPNEDIHHIHSHIHRQMEIEGIRGLPLGGLVLNVFHPQEWFNVGEINPTNGAVFWSSEYGSFVDEKGQIKIGAINMGYHEQPIMYLMSSKMFKRIYRPNDMLPEDEFWPVRLYNYLCSLPRSLSSSISIYAAVANPPAPKEEVTSPSFYANAGQEPKPTSTPQVPADNSVSLFSNLESINRRRQGWLELGDEQHPPASVV